MDFRRWCVAMGLGRSMSNDVLVPARCRGRGLAGRAGRGFTLLEVLVAVGIAGVALVAAIKAVGTLTVAAEQARMRAYAQWSAENRLALLRLSRAFPEPGRNLVNCNQGGVALTCVEEFQRVQNPLFRRVDVKVYPGELSGEQIPKDAPGFVARMFGYLQSTP